MFIEFFWGPVEDSLRIHHGGYITDMDRCENPALFLAFHQLVDRAFKFPVDTGDYENAHDEFSFEERNGFLEELVTVDEHGATYYLGNGIWRKWCNVTEQSSLWAEVSNNQLMGELLAHGAAGYYMPDGTPTVQIPA